MVTVSLDSPSCEVTLFDPVSVVYRDATRQAKGLYRLKHVGVLWSGLACLSRYNSGWFCHRGQRRLPVGGLGWGWRWPEEDCQREQWGSGVEVARWRPSSEVGVVWGSQGASRGHRKLIHGLDLGGSGAEAGSRQQGRAVALMARWWWCSDACEQGRRGWARPSEGRCGWDKATHRAWLD
jgi:hypothetical protein